MQVNCFYCGKSFNRRRSQVLKYIKNFCSNTCRHHQKEAHRMIKCGVCGKEFKTYKSTMAQGRAKFCSRKCYNTSKIGHIPWNKGTKGVMPSGKNHPNYRPGLNRNGYPTDWKETLKEAIRQRDQHKCQICGTPQEECIRKLDVHHIDYDKHNLELHNLISLCLNCHMKTNYDRERWKKKLTIHQRGENTMVTRLTLTEKVI